MQSKDPKDQRIFVAGATGYLGKHIVQEALKRGYNVRALTRNKARLLAAIQVPHGHTPSNLEVVEGEVTQPETLRGLTKDCDILFSSIGITKQQDKGATYMDVDYGANRNLLDEATASKSVTRFIYTHVLHADKLLHVELVAAKHRFVTDLINEYQRTNRIRPCVVCPSGFYSDLEEVLEMALSGRVYVFGEATELLSPIWGGDLACAILDAVEEGQEEEQHIPIGGPETLSFMEVAELAKQAVEEGYAEESKPRQVGISGIPRWITDTLVWLAQKLTSQKTYGPVHFISEASKHDMSAPKFGTKTLLDFYREKVDEHKRKEADI